MRASTYGRQSRSSEKSINEQLDAGHQVIADQDWTNAGDYQDGKSASRFGTKIRGGWADINRAIMAHLLDVLILWESSRGDRTAATWLAFLDDCRAHQVRIYVATHERLYDLKNARDWKTLAEDGIGNAYESELISIRTRRGHAGAAKEGKPAGGPVLYGYRKVFHPETGKRTGQTVYEPEAKQIRRMFELLSRNVPVRSTATMLNATETGGTHWTPTRVRRLAGNPAYVALRGHNGSEYPAVWDGIVSEKLFYAVQRVLNEPGRRLTRPGKQVHLLSYLAHCDVCGEYMDAARGVYRCHKSNHVSIHEGFTDEVVTQVVKTRLKQPDALEAFTRTNPADDRVAEGELQKLKARLDEFRTKAVAGIVSIETLNLAETELSDQIAQLERQLREQTVPPALLDMLDGNVDERWNAATLGARRAVIKALCDIKVVSIPGLSGRPADNVMRKRALIRLRESRWHGDTRTWGETWAELG